MINRILMFMSILFMINIVLVGIGVYDQAVLEADQYTILNKDVSDIDDLSDATDVSTVDVGESSSVFDSLAQLTLVPEVTQAYSGLKTILKFAGGLVFGWSSVFIVLGFPTLLIYGLTAIIGLLQVFSIFYIVAYFISTLSGGGI